MRALRTLLVAGLALGACQTSEVGSSLTVFVRTDAIPGVEFHTVLTELFVDDGVTPRVVATAERRVFAGERFDEVPGEVARLLPQSDGAYLVRVTLLSRDGTRPTLRRTQPIDLPQAEGVILTIDRACLEVSCPDEGGGDECVGGTCTDPLCAANPADCGLPSACETDADCPAPDACAEATCSRGVCLAVAVPDSCPGESYCHPALGCVPYAEPDRCGSPCTDPEDSCGIGYLRCDPGELPTCVPFLRRPAGTPCDGGMCDGAGGCMPCEGGTPCRRGCDEGAVVCNEDGTGECVLDGGRTPEGERCHPDDFCVEGSPCTFVGTCDGSGVCVGDPDPGATVTPARDLATTENGVSDRLELVLRAQPSAEVRVTLVASPEGEVTLTPGELVFGVDDWDTPQAVVVTGVNDMVVDGDQPFAIAFAFASTDAGYAALALADKAGVNADFEEGACTLPDGECDANPGTVCETPLDTATDCGACGAACPAGLPGATGMCVFDPGFTPSCEATCDPGFANCNGDVPDGCEVRTTVDRMNCGSCGMVCPSRPNADTTCAAGRCGYECRAGFADCNGAASDGCEVELATDVMHCGSCGTTCPTPPNTTASCTAGTCETTCVGRFADCDGVTGNGCEVDVNGDVDHCSTCGNVCPDRPNASRTCEAGTCRFACDAAFEDCNGIDVDGCEADLNSTASCGGCMACAEPPNATASCDAMTCDFTCAGGFEDCDGMAGNGCEADLDSVDTCGRCMACPEPPNASAICDSMTCDFTCAAPFADCDGIPGNGCEANTFSVSSCGPGCAMCPVPANAIAGCNGTNCTFSCLDDYADCDGMSANGCEVLLLDDDRNCGACGNECPSGPCVDGSCTGGGCGMTGERCDDVAVFCCDGLPCTSGVCPTCVPPGVDCGGTVVCCDGSSCIDGKCPMACGRDGELCEMASDCCDGFACDRGNCTSRCSGAGVECGEGMPCCNPLSCDMGRGVCMGGECGPMGSLCEMDGDCCAGLTCRSGRCDGGF